MFWNTFFWLFSFLSTSILVAESYTGGKIAFKEDEGIEVDPKENHGISRKKTINNEVWENIEKLHKGEGWPRSDLYVQKKYDELLKEYQQWPDRVLALNEAFNTRMKQDGAKGPEEGAKSEL